VRPRGKFSCEFHTETGVTVRELEFHVDPFVGVAPGTLMVRCFLRCVLLFFVVFFILERFIFTALPKGLRQGHRPAKWDILPFHGKLCSFKDFQPVYTTLETHKHLHTLLPPSLTHALTHSLAPPTHSITQLLNHSLTYSHSLTHLLSPTHSLTYSLTRSFLLFPPL
jgi:hypothetical protein